MAGATNIAPPAILPTLEFANSPTFEKILLASVSSGLTIFSTVVSAFGASGSGASASGSGASASGSSGSSGAGAGAGKEET